jgi:hypothetical protein
VKHFERLEAVKPNVAWEEDKVEVLAQLFKYFNGTVDERDATRIRQWVLNFRFCICVSLQ